MEAERLIKEHPGNGLSLIARTVLAAALNCVII